MRKRYFEIMKKGDCQLPFEREVFLVEEEDIIKEYSLDRCLYIHKDDFVKDKYNLENYKLEPELSDCMVDEEVYLDMFVICLFNNKNMYDFFDFVLNKSLFIDTSLDEIIETYNNEMKESKFTSQEIRAFLDKLENHEGDIEYLEEVVYLWNGRNNQRIVVEGFYDEVVDVTDKYKDLVHVDDCSAEAGHFYLKKSPVSNETVLIYNSFSQGLPTSTYYDVKANKIEEAINYVENEKDKLA